MYDWVVNCCSALKIERWGKLKDGELMKVVVEKSKSADGQCIITFLGHSNGHPYARSPTPPPPSSVIGQGYWAWTVGRSIFDRLSIGNLILSRSRCSGRFSVRFYSNSQMEIPEHVGTQSSLNQVRKSATGIRHASERNTLEWI